jgi:hypothetical protein
MNTDQDASSFVSPTTARAAIALVVGGFVVLVGSFLDWGTCPDTSCGKDGGALFVLVDKSGIDFGPGILTALLGIVLAAGGVSVLRIGGPPAFRAGAVLLALIVLATVGAFYVRMYVFPEFLLYGPGFGLVLVAAGGLIALAASLRLRRPVHARPTPAPN